MGGVSVVGSTIGALAAPSGENRIAHAALWGGLSTAAAGGMGLYIFDEEAKRRDAEAKVAKLEKELASFNEELSPELVATNRVGFERPLPNRFKNLITPGQWSLYKVDRWTTSGESELVHQDLIFRFHQPQLNPAAKLNETQGSEK